MSLLPRTTPKLTHQSRNSNRRAPSPSQTKPNVDLILHQGHKTTPEKKQIWYKRKILSSDIDETDDTEYGQSADDNGDASDSIEKTPSPRKPIQNFFDFVSTPINPDSTVSFLSPMRMLNDLHLKSQVFDDDETGNDVIIEASHGIAETIHEQVGEEDDVNDENSIGNKTMINNSDESEDDFPISPPKFINRKKRMHLDAIGSRIVTPIMQQDSHMSICNTTNTSHNSSLKFSFSTNDSTPCPPQPKRKKLKFKHASTENILDLNYARKTSVQELPQRPERPLQAFDDDDDDADDGKNNSNSFDKHNDLESTPISQSTPTSLRASTPPLPPPPPTAPTQEYGPTINGFKFVRPRPNSSQFKYETPINGNRYAQMRNSYNRQNYSVVGELPVTSAGMMDEEGVHVGDKRINDPYLTPQTAPPTTTLNERLRFEYHNKMKLPLLPPHFDQDDLSTEQILHLITQDSLKKFYNLIAEGSMLDLLRQERIKWHPDKWVGKLKQYPDGNITISVIDRLSQTINALIDNYN